MASESYECMCTYDSMSKKRKKWFDARLLLTLSSGHVSIKNDEHKVIYSGTLDKKKLQLLIADNEEVSLTGALLCLLGDKIDLKYTSLPDEGGQQAAKVMRLDRQETAFIAPLLPVATQSSSSLPPKLVPVPSKPFKTPSTSLLLVRPFQPPSTTTLSSSSSSSSSLSSSGVASVGVVGAAHVASYSTNTADDNLYQLNNLMMRVLVTYEESTRSCTINRSFPDPISYALQYLHAMAEEIMLSVANVMKSIEKKAFACINIDYKSIVRYSGRRQQHQQQNHTVKQMGQQRPSTEQIHDKIRRAGIGYAIHVETIISVPDTEKKKFEPKAYHKHNSMKYRSNNCDDDDDIDKDSKGCAGRINSGSNTSSSNSSDSSGSSGDANKLYLKFPASCKEAPKDGESFGKGDVWLCWNPDNAAVLDIPQILDYKQITNSCNRDDISKLISKIMESYNYHRTVNGYPFPFFGGVLFKPVWLVRSLWHSISDQGLLEVGNIDPSITSVPVFVGKKTRGVLENKINAVRVTNVSTELLALSLLLSAPSCIQEAKLLKHSSIGSSKLVVHRPPVRIVLRFVHLLSSPVFHEMMRGTRTCSSNAVSGSAFPSIDSENLKAIVTDTCNTFRLNAEQAVVVKRVGNWFDSTIKEPENIILVHGVFGCGKSYVIVACCYLIKQIQIACSCKQVKVLLSSSTNVAVDRIMKSLADMHECISIARIGCAEKIDKALRKHLVLMAETRSGAEKEVMRLLKTNSNDSALLQLLAATKKESFNDVQKSILSNADVVGVTCASAVNHLLLPLAFPIVILDEASQMTEPTSLLPLGLAGAARMLLVGDPLQLPPTLSMSTLSMSGPSSAVDDIDGSKGYLHRTLFDRLSQLNCAVTILGTQYRCHPSIANLCSNLFYSGKLTTGLSAFDRPSMYAKIPPLIAVNNSSAEERRGESYINRGEAVVIQSLVQWLVNHVKSDFSIGIICLYKAQVFFIRSLLLEIMQDIQQQPSVNWMVSTVDAFQGNECDIIVISTCTSREGVNEFVGNQNRLNVAISRAKNHLFLVGNVQVLNSLTVWKEIFKVCRRHNTVESFFADNKTIDSCDNTSYYDENDDANAAFEQEILNAMQYED